MYSDDDMTVNLLKHQYQCFLHYRIFYLNDNKNDNYDNNIFIFWGQIPFFIFTIVKGLALVIKAHFKDD